MEIFVILALTVVVILILGYPLLKPVRSGEADVSPGFKPDHSDLYGKREIVFEALRDLQFEYAMGKLASGDYERLKGRYEAQAAAIIQEIDALKQTKKSKTRSQRR